MAFKILQYNIAHGRGNDTTSDKISWLGPLGLMAGSLKKNFRVRRAGKESLISRLEETACVIDACGVSVACFNEIDFDCSWSFGIDMLEFFSEKLKFPYLAKGLKFDFKLSGISVCHGVGIISCFPIQESKYSVCCTESFSKRIFGGVGYLGVVLTVNGVNLRLISCHLSPGQKGETQTKEIYENCISRSEYPVIVAGDLNARLTHHQTEHGQFKFKNLDNLLGDRLRTAKQLFETGSEEKYATFFSQYLGFDECIDHILVDKELEIGNYKVLDLPYSDHKPVFLEVKIPHKVQA